MKLQVTLKYKDDSTGTFDCVDFPSIGEFLTLYLENFERKMIAKEKIDEINYKFV